MDAAYRPPLGLKLTKSPSMVEWFTEQLEMQHYSHQPAGLSDVRLCHAEQRELAEAGMLPSCSFQALRLPAAPLVV